MDFRFPFAFSTTGGSGTQTSVSIADQVEKVKMSIAVILGTKIGSRVIERDFGADLRGLIFDNMDETTYVRVRMAVVEALTRWEKRIEILDVSFDETFRKEGILNVNLHFRIISSQVEGNMVWPFYLTPETKAKAIIVN